MIKLGIYCNSDVIDVTFYSRSRSKTKQVTRETSCYHLHRNQDREIIKRLARQLQSFTLRSRSRSGSSSRTKQVTRETSCNHHNRGIATSTVDLDLFVSFYSFVINLFNLLFVARKRLLEAISFKKNLYKIETIFVF